MPVNAEMWFIHLTHQFTIKTSWKHHNHMISFNIKSLYSYFCSHLFICTCTSEPLKPVASDLSPIHSIKSFFFLLTQQTKTLLIEWDSLKLSCVCNCISQAFPSLCSRLCKCWPRRPRRQAKLYSDQSVAINSSTIEVPLNVTHLAASNQLITSHSRKFYKLNRCVRLIHLPAVTKDWLNWITAHPGLWGAVTKMFLSKTPCLRPIGWRLKASSEILE